VPYYSNAAGIYDRKRPQVIESGESVIELISFKQSHL
jgi:hypothetical protein